VIHAASLLQAVVRAERLRRDQVRRTSGPLEVFSPEVGPCSLQLMVHKGECFDTSKDIDRLCFMAG
jgi:hypothetical protein